MSVAADCLKDYDISVAPASSSAHAIISPPLSDIWTGVKWLLSNASVPFGDPRMENVKDRDRKRERERERGRERERDTEGTQIMRFIDFSFLFFINFSVLKSTTFLYERVVKSPQGIVQGIRFPSSHIP